MPPPLSSPTALGQGSEPQAVTAEFGWDVAWRPDGGVFNCRRTAVEQLWARSIASRTGRSRPL